MDNTIRIKELFKSIDQKDTVSFCSYLTEDAVFRFGNAPAVKRKEEIESAIEGFFNSIHSLSHDVDNIWEFENNVVCNGTVNYTRLDKSTLEVPFVNVFQLENGLFKEYLIYVDASELYR